VIVVATDDFEVYHDIVGELRDRGVAFTTVEPGDPLPEDTGVVVTTADEAPLEALSEPPAVTVVEADPAEPRRTVEQAVAVLRGGDGRTIIGIDPGERPGIAVLAGDVAVGAFQVPEAQAAEVVAAELESAVDPLVRIGDGARLVGARLIEALPDVTIELVDETGTTPYLGSGARGMDDVLAAVNIAHLPGEEIQSRDVEPTAGELQRIKERSRQESETNRAIDDALARRVASGDLSVDEALAEHRARDE
jgi:hypothetical protein